KKEGHRGAKKGFVLEKERALLGEVDGIALVDGDLRILRLNLAEIRIYRGVDGEMVVDDELGVHPRLALHVGMLKIRIGGIASIERAKTAEQAIRNEFDVAPRRNAFETGQSSSLTEPALDPLRDVRPERILSLPRNAAVEDDSPLLHISRRKAQALKR